MNHYRYVAWVLMKHREKAKWEQHRNSMCCFE